MSSETTSTVALTLSIVATAAASIVISWIAFKLLLDMAAESERIETLSEMVDKTRALHISVAVLEGEAMREEERRQLERLLTSLHRLLDGVTPRDAREERLAEVTRKGYRDFARLTELWFTTTGSADATAERREVLSNQLFIKAQLITDDTRRLRDISQARVAAARDRTAITVVALVILLALTTAAIYGASIGRIIWVQRALRDERDDAQRLHRLMTDMAGSDAQSLYERLMDAAVDIMRSDFASLQMLHPEHGAAGGRGELNLLAHRGFPADAARHWERVRADSACTCGIALASGRRCHVGDVLADPRIAGDDRAVYVSAGIRAVQTTPLVARDGRLLGAISTHWRTTRQPGALTERDWRMLDVLARHGADLLERLDRGRALQASEERYRLLAGIVTDIPWTTDAAGAFVEPQPAWQAYTGQSWEESRGFGWADALHPDDRGRIRADWSKSCREEVSYDVRGRLWHAQTQQYRHFHARATILRDADGRVRQWVGSCTDVHEQQQADDILREADRRKNEFLATLAHELRNPLAPIRNVVQLMHIKGAAAPELQWGREVIDRQVQQMTRLIDDLMEVGRISQGKLQLKRERISLATVIQGAVETARPLIDQSQHQLVVNLPPQPIELDADLTRLAQVFSNVLNNAAKYTPPGGHITLTAELHGAFTSVSIKDSGIGIPGDRLHSVFDLFAQVEDTLHRSQGGLGIGLALARRLVEMHGGSIEAHSVGRGHGSEFVVRLPVAPRSAISPDPTDPDRASAVPSSLRVLIVDDNRDAADSLALMFKALGNDVRTAHDGLEAFDAAGSFRPRLVLLDIGLPGANGFEVCRRIRQQPWGRQMCLIAITGWGQASDQRKAREAGFDRHLVKPVDPGRLLGLLGTLLTSAGQEERPESMRTIDGN